MVIHAEGIKSKKTKAKLHKPYLNIKEMLDEIKLFSENLHLCCLMTYGCLLRPHREIRELTWMTFLMTLTTLIYQEIETNLEEIELFLYHLILEIFL